MTFPGSVRLRFLTVDSGVHSSSVRAVTPPWGHFCHSGMYSQGPGMLNILHNELFHSKYQKPLEKQRTQGQVHRYANCAVRQGSVLDLMLCSHHFENLNTFMFECLFYRWSPVVQCIIYTNRSGNGCVLSSLPLCVYTVFMIPHQHRILVDLWHIRTLKSQGEYKISILHLWLI